ncbi:MAG: hypothetical protein HY645_14915 [Acidobacteria bacterium]|nr:hypothetical protein [Acidobacteriota bacterium]
MGYYTSVGICLSAKKEKIAELRSRVEELRSACQNDENHWFWYYDDVEIRDDGAIEFAEYDRKWYEEEQFYELLSPFVMQGYIEGQGEEFGDVWRVCFDGRGGFKRQVAVFADEDKVAQRESEAMPSKEREQ